MVLGLARVRVGIRVRVGVGVEAHVPPCTEPRLDTGLSARHKGGHL